MCDVTWLRWTSALALVGALTQPPARAQGPVGSPDSEDVRKALDDLAQGTRGSFDAAQKSIDALKEEVGRLRREVEDLRKERRPITRDARYGAATAPAGTIRLVNEYVMPMTVVVNGTSYPLEPGETRMLRRMPAGPFTYRIPGVKEEVDRTLYANETFTIQIHVR